MQERRPWELLYDAVATGMRLYSDSAFRVIVLGRERLRLQRHLLLVSTHRSDADVPIICGRLYFGDRMYLRHGLRLHFAARDDLFERGVIAGLLPPTVPPALRRAVYAFDPAPYMPRVRVNPIRSPATLQAVQALRFGPHAPLRSALPGALVEALCERARSFGIPPPVAAGDADRAEFADLVWTEVSRDELPDASDLWRAHAREGAADLRRLIEVLRRGEPLLLFPEGSPSPDGSIGPLRRGLGLLVRRGGPRAILPIALAYDALTRGRPRAFLAVGEAFSPPRADIEGGVLEQLRRTTPLTCAQVVANRLLRAAEAGEETVAPAALDRALAAAAEEATTEGRPVDPALTSAGSRRGRLSGCLEALARAALVDVGEGRTLKLDPDRLRADATVRRAALEYASARASAPIAAPSA